MAIGFPKIMPYYDFECEECHKTFDKYLPYQQRNESVECPLCPSWKTVRLIGLPGVSNGNSGKKESGGSSCCSGGGCDC